MSFPDLALEVLVGGSSRTSVPELPDGTVLDPLGAMAAARTLVRAGVVLPAGAGEGGPIPESWSPAPARAVKILEELLEGPEVVVVAEWLRLASSEEVLPPARLWPVILRLAESSEAVASALDRVQSSTLTWVSGQNPAWRRFVRVGMEGWKDATSAQRIRLVQRLDDDELTDAVRNRLSELPARARAEVLAAVTTLPLDLVGTCEDLLDDRSDLVRAQAVRLLSGVESPLSERVAAHVPALITRSGRVRTTLSFTPPPALDAVMVRDGIDLDTTIRPDPVGWLHQVAALAPLRAWEKAARLDPTGLVRATLARAKEDSVLAPVVLRGWKRAALDQQDQRWSRALLPAHPRPHDHYALLAVLPDRERVEALMRTGSMMAAHAFAHLQEDGRPQVGPELEDHVLRTTPDGSGSSLAAFIRTTHERNRVTGPLGSGIALWDLRRELHQHLGDHP